MPYMDGMGMEYVVPHAPNLYQTCASTFNHGFPDGMGRGYGNCMKTQVY